jgi:hypothetical protein
MKDKNINQSPSLSARMVEPEEVERLKKRARDMGLIVNTGVSKKDSPTGKKKADKK